MNKDLIAIFEYLEREKGIKRETIIDAIEESLKMAARKSVKGYINVSVNINPRTGDIDVIAQKEVVDKVTMPQEEISLEDARILNPDCQIHDWIDLTITPRDFGRIAAQTARQVISQKLKEAEKNVISEEYKHRIHEIVSGTVKKIVRGGTLIVDLGKAEAIMPEKFYPKTEHYNLGDKVQALLYEVRDTEGGGAEVVLSRSHPEFVVQLLDQEVPEIHDGIVIIEKISRDPGYRTKIAVASTDPKIDPVGATVGVRGTRIKNVIRELNNEKIDVIPYSDDFMTLLKNLLAPTEPKKIDINEENNEVFLVVDEEAYPIVLGKKGGNLRLCSQILGKEIRIQKLTEYRELKSVERQELASSDDPLLDEPITSIKGINSLILEDLIATGFETRRKLLSVTPQEISKISGISTEMVEKITEQIRKERE